MRFLRISARYDKKDARNMMPHVPCVFLPILSLYLRLTDHAADVVRYAGPLPADNKSLIDASFYDFTILPCRIDQKH